MDEVLIVLLITNLIAIAFGLTFMRRTLRILPKYITEEDNYLTEIAKRGGLLFLGDSLIQFYDTNAFFSGELTHNRGVSGNTVSQVTERLETSVYPVRPDKIFILAGTNDLNKKAQPQEVFESIAGVCALIAQNLPDTATNVISLLPVNPKAGRLARIVVGKRNNEDIRSVNALLRPYCEKNNLGYIDAHSALCDTQGNLNAVYSLDGLHINFKGYKKLTELVRKYI
ncbi:MAG: GDSL-type esterase/lipase family protein [Christensenellales bacterium]|jgi:lysophospholipase L1-like esterase